MRLSEDPELLEFFGLNAVLEQERAQRADIRNLIAQRERAGRECAIAKANKESASAEAVVNRFDDALANAILAPLGLTPSSQKDASMIASLLTGLVAYNRRTGTVRGSDFCESDETVFTAAAGYAGVSPSDALSLNVAIRARMRELVP
jgi:hypothetical protein